MRHFALSLGFVLLTACGNRTHPVVEPNLAPSILFVDSGDVVRAELINGKVVTGSLLARYHSGDTLVLICDQARMPCVDGGGVGMHTVRKMSVRSLAVRGRMRGVYGQRGVYIGALGGLAADKEGSAWLMVGAAVGGFIGQAIGSRVTGWIRLFPCWHACGWRSESSAADPDPETAILGTTASESGAAVDHR